MCAFHIGVGGLALCIFLALGIPVGATTALSNAKPVSNRLRPLHRRWVMHLALELAVSALGFIVFYYFGVGLWRWIRASALAGFPNAKLFALGTLWVHACVRACARACVRVRVCVCVCVFADVSSSLTVSYLMFTSYVFPKQLSAAGVLTV